MCKACEEYEHSLTIKDRDELLRLGNDLARAIATGVSELPRGGMTGGGDVAYSETWRAFSQSLNAWNRYMQARDE